MKHPARSAQLRNSDLFRYRLNSYALAAGATGVGLLALAEPAEAKIVYTPAHTVIGNGASYLIDFNHDGTTDLTIRNIPGQYCTFDGSCHPIESLAALSPKSNQVVHNIYGAVAMKPGMNVGPTDTFHAGAQRMVWSFGTYAWGSWINVKNRYLGVQLKINGKTHYGWVRLSVQVQSPMQVTATLTGYAFETDVNKPIVAGKTSGDDADPEASSSMPGTARQSASLGVLALGAQGIPLWRRRESAIGTSGNN
jgi:hypothetical protein